ncbi:MAG: bifunctional hydroxymethylpyrimidine kinase/phosphomethylpyrimidine kinase [Geobacteraceae bacterium]|nr:bifunctional hydroxymethylpyrimidine kinase/phosphomethylpyrimidine kinase [Geobacteraceae bacterium]
MRKFRPGLHLLADLGATSFGSLEKIIRSGYISCLRYRISTREPTLQDTGARTIMALCESAGIPCLVEDDLELAISLAAQGVHLNSVTPALAMVRKTLGPGKTIGVTVRDAREAAHAAALGVDYLHWELQPSASHASSSPGILQKNIVASKISRSIPVVVPCLFERQSADDLLQQGADALILSPGALPETVTTLDLAEVALLFNRHTPFPRGSVLTLAGSDSGAGAGIQGDLKTISLLGSYASTVISCLTAQNTLGVLSVYQPPATFFSEQLHAVLSDVPVDVIKTGMLHSEEIIETFSEALEEYGEKLLVVDPVMTAKGGWQLLEDKARSALVNLLLPRCYLITPNIPEAEKLTGLSIDEEGGMVEAAYELREQGARNILIKGGHLDGDTAVDILLEGNSVHRFAAERVSHGNTHGTGCTYASAIATLIAQGEVLPTAVSRGKEFLTAAIIHARPFGSGHGPLNHFQATQEFRRDREPGG